MPSCLMSHFSCLSEALPAEVQAGDVYLALMRRVLPWVAALKLRSLRRAE